MIGKNKKKKVDVGTELVEGGTASKKSLPTSVKIGVPILIVILFIGVPVMISILLGNGVSGGSGVTAQVDVIEVTSEDITEEITVTGVVSSDNVKTYFSPVNGTIKNCDVKVGQVVQKGDVLISYDEDELEYANQQSEFTYKQSQSEYNVAVANDAKLKADIAEAKGEVSSVKKKISSTESTIKSLQNSLSSLSTQQVNKQAEIVELESQITELEQGKAEDTPTEDSENSDGNGTTEDTNLADLEAKLVKAESELASINSQITTKTASVESKVQELSKLEAELAQNEAIVDSGSAGMTGEQLEVLAMSSNLAELADLEADELLELGKKGIVAEFDGVIASVNGIEGMQTAQGMELITVASNKAVSVDVEIPATEFDSVRVGNPVEIVINSYEYKGEVSEVSQIATMNTSGTSVIATRINILDSDDNMFLGVTAKNKIITESKKDVLCVPSSIINTSTDGEFVYVLVDGIVEKRMVELGVTSLDKIEVVSGLEEGDMVISDMVAVLTEGMKAEPKSSIGDEGSVSGTEVKPKVSVAMKGQ